MIEFAEVPIGTGGVLSCSRCGAAPEARPFTAEDVFVAIASATVDAPTPGPNVVLCGFEPFRHPALPALIGACTGAGVQRVMLRTHGNELARAGNAAGCFSAGVRALEIVRLAEGARHDSLAGVPGSCAASDAGVAAFRQAAGEWGAEVAIFGVVPACRHNSADLAATVVSLARIGAVAVRIEAGALNVTADTAALLEAAIHTGAVNRVAVAVTGWRGDLPAGADRAPYALSGAAQ